MKKDISFEEAYSIIIEKTEVLPSEKVFIISALNRVSAEDVYAPYNIPFADNSAMDGYAIISDDTKDATKDNPSKLKLIDVIPAGKGEKITLKRGFAVKIMTGAVIPEGANAIARKEICEEKDGYVYIYEKVEKGKDLRKKGEDIKKGEKVIEKGKIITPSVCGVLASLGKSMIKVYRQPKVGLIITGDEIVDIDENLTFGKVKNSNAYSLLALLKEVGAISFYSGIIKDKKEELLKAIIENSNLDCILSTGGVSVGDYDYTKEVIKEAGFEIHFWRARVKPGKPILFATKNKTLFFGIPGNPVSTMVTFYNFIRPALLKMQGFKEINLPTEEAILSAPIKRKDTRKEFIRGILYKDGDNFYVKPTGAQGSGILTSMLKGNCFIVVDEGVENVEVGDRVKVKIFDRFK